MKQNISEIKGTIANTLMQHKDELFQLMISQSQFTELQQKVNDLLESAELKSKEDTAAAKQIFNNCSRKYNLYLSTLMTYLTGIKVS